MRSDLYSWRYWPPSSTLASQVASWWISHSKLDRSRLQLRSFASNGFERCSDDFHFKFQCDPTFAREDNSLKVLVLCLGGYLSRNFLTGKGIPTVLSRHLPPIQLPRTIDAVYPWLDPKVVPPWGSKACHGLFGLWLVILREKWLRHDLSSYLETRRARRQNVYGETPQAWSSLFDLFVLYRLVM